MKKKITIIVTIILLVCILGLLVYFENKNKTQNENSLNILQNTENNISSELNKMKEAGIQEEFYEDVVILHNDIYNYEKLDNFIKYVNSSYNVNSNLEKETIRIIGYTTEGDPIIKTVEYNPDTSNANGNTLLVVSEDYTRDELSIEKATTKSYNLNEWQLQKNYYKDEEGTEWIRVALDNQITNTNSEDIMPLICEYKLSSIGYTRDFEITFEQRKDMGAKKIINKDESTLYDYNIFTLGGDVIITIEKDMVYYFDEALNSKVITIDQILEQAKIDEEAGICSVVSLKDGGTKIYTYKKYILIKYDDLEGNKDFVICPSNTQFKEVANYIYEE